MSTPKLVLIVEDSETCAETLQMALERIPGLETRVIRSVGEALAALHDNHSEIAAIVTDLHLLASNAESDGMALIRQLRAEARYSQLPIFLVSGDSDPLLPARALAQGADAFFPKPYSPSAVRKKLEQFLC